VNIKKARKDPTEFRELASKVSTIHAELAEYFGVSVRTVYRWWYGETKVPVSVMRALQLLLKKK
jgi:DNA-binding transcriptional regulator YiaG